MNHPIPAPSGYEGCVYFDTNVRAWYASYRKIGATWWKRGGPFGHAHLPLAEVIERAAAEIARSITHTP